jgi:hypothetical protein
MRNLLHREAPHTPQRALGAGPAPPMLKAGCRVISPIPRILFAKTVPSPVAGRHRPSYFNAHALAMADNGFTVIPTKGKEPVTKRWQNPKPTDREWLRKMVRRNRYADCNVGIVCGRVVGIDIDADQATEADRLKSLAFEHLGQTGFIRVGRPPRLLLLYRPCDDIDSTKIGCVDILSFGKQFVAYGIHPDTDQPYNWMDSHLNPTSAKLDGLPIISGAAVRTFVEAYSRQVNPLAEGTRSSISNTTGAMKSYQRASPRDFPAHQSQYESRISRDERGIVVDGREAFMAKLTAAQYARGDFGSPQELANKVWAEFSAKADLSRPKSSNPLARWSARDALAKARHICQRRPDLKRPRRARGRHPASQLHTWRRREFWSVEQRERHMAEVVRRNTRPSIVAVARAMIEAVDFDTGLCKLTISETGKRVSSSPKTVKVARAELVNAGLWLAIRGTYVPVPCTTSLTTAKSRQTKAKSALVAPSRVRLSESQVTNGKGKKISVGTRKGASVYHLLCLSGGGVSGGVGVVRTLPVPFPLGSRDSNHSHRHRHIRPTYSAVPLLILTAIGVGTFRSMWLWQCARNAEHAA